MFQNIKVDIIYYKTHTDFEMEFNLCGCCRMRLLTDKSPDRKTAVHSLARAVSRSKVIMMIGSLFGDDGILNLCAGAIGTTLSPVDNKAYGISGDDQIEILNGSTPLVTPEGYFGGCIIESGPQTMILLSDNKNIRKSVMNTLIHPYIKELCAMELTEDTNSHTTAEEAPETPAMEETPEATIPVIPETPEADMVGENISDEENLPETADDEDNTEIISMPDAQTEDQDFIQDSLLEQAIEDDIELVLDQDNNDTEIADDTDDEPVGFIFEAEDTDNTIAEPIPEEYDESDEEASAFYTELDETVLPEEESIDLSSFEDAFKDIISEQDEEYKGIDEFEDAEDFEDYKEFLKIQRARALNMPIAIIAILLLVLVAVVCYCIFYVPAKDGISASEYLREIFTTLFG